MLSKLNVENVVKPPQRPTRSNKESCSLSIVPFRTSAAMNARQNEPATLIANVAIGNVESDGIKPHRYRKTEPTNPPAPTAKQFTSI